jgi:hypothetical protein
VTAQFPGVSGCAVMAIKEITKAIVIANFAPIFLPGNEAIPPKTLPKKNFSQRIVFLSY